MLTVLKRPNTRIALILYSVALAFRLVYLAQVSDLPIMTTPVMDEGYHVELAQEILGGKVLNDRPFYRAPLYPYFFSALMFITGENLITVRVIQSILGALLPVLLFFLGLKLFERRVALAAAGVATFYPTFFYYDNALLITSLMTLLATLVVYRAALSEERPTVRNFAILGALIGLTALARPNILFLLPALALWFWIVVRARFNHSFKQTALSYLIVIISAVVVIAPVTIRNWTVSGEFIPIAWQGGYNFYLGNNRDATGWSATAPGIRSSWQGGYEDAIHLAESREGRKLNEKQVDDFWWEMGWNEVTENPLQFVQLISKKKLYFFAGYEIPNNQNIYLVERTSWLADVLFTRSPLQLPYGLIAPLALLGMALSLRRWRKNLLLYLFFASYFASVILFFVCARYRMPVIPVMLLFASFAAFQLIAFVKEKRIRASVISIATLVALIGISNYDAIGKSRNRTNAEDAFLLGSSYQLQRDIYNAERMFLEALAYDSTYVDAGVNLGILAAQRGDLATAERYLRDVLKVDPDIPEALMNLGMVYVQEERLDDARILLERARELQPLDYNVQYRLGLVYHLQEKYELARESYRAALRLKPEFQPAVENLRIVEGVLNGG